MWCPLPKGPLPLVRSCLGSPGKEMVKFSSVDLTFGHSDCLNPPAKSTNKNMATNFIFLSMATFTLHFSRPNAGLQLRRAISIQAEGKRLLENHATAPSAARLCSSALGL